MALHNDDRGQLYTIEGIIASLILLGVLLFIIQANSLVVPQTEKISDMKLQQKANDILTCIEISNGSNHGNDLKTYVEIWDGTPANPSSNGGVAAGQTINADGKPVNLSVLDDRITSMLSPDERYNLTISYNSSMQTSTLQTDIPIIIKGHPGDNSVVATKLVTLYPDDSQLSDFWKHKIGYKIIIRW